MAWQPTADMGKTAGSAGVSSCGCWFSNEIHGYCAAHQPPLNLPTDWQPIDTCPQKGPILVCRDGLIWIARHPLMTKVQGKPTHWMAIPAPPDAL